MKSKDDAFEDDPESSFAIWRKTNQQPSRDLEVGDSETFCKKDGTVKRIIFKDYLAEIQNNNIEQAELSINTLALNQYIKTDLNKETVEDLNLTGENGLISMNLYTSISCNSSIFKRS